MMNEEHIEKTLRRAPSPLAPEGLLERLESNIRLPAETNSARHVGRSRLTYWFPAVSLAACAVVLAAVFLWPAPTAYSFQASIEAIRKQHGLHLIERHRNGPSQPINLPNSTNATTSYHPANPMVGSEVRRTVRNGRHLSHSVSATGETRQNGPLVLALNRETGERTFLLSPPDFRSDPAPEDWFLELEEQAARGEIDYEIVNGSSANGEIEILIRPLESGFTFDPGEEHWRLWVDERTHLPLRFQVISTAFPEFGDEVVMSEFELIGFGDDFDASLFEIDPTDEELEKFGLTREELPHLPENTISMEVEGDTDSRYIAWITDDTGSREISGDYPLVLVKTPRGDTIIDLWNENRERGTFDVVAGDFHMIAGGDRIVIHLTENASARIAAVPGHIEDLEAFLRDQ